jgi:hypothetical protein
MAELGKSEAADIENKAGWGIWCSPEIIYAAYLDYRSKNLLPEAGGTLDQDPHIMRSFQQLDALVAWYREQDQRPDEDELAIWH